MLTCCCYSIFGQVEIVQLREHIQKTEQLARRKLIEELGKLQNLARIELDQRMRKEQQEIERLKGAAMLAEIDHNTQIQKLKNEILDAQVGVIETRHYALENAVEHQDRSFEYAKQQSKKLQIATEVTQSRSIVDEVLHESEGTSILNAIVPQYTKLGSRLVSQQRDASVGQPHNDIVDNHKKLSSSSYDKYTGRSKATSVSKANTFKSSSGQNPNADGKSPVRRSLRGPHTQPSQHAVSTTSSMSKALNSKPKAISTGGKFFHHRNITSGQDQSDQVSSTLSILHFGTLNPCTNAHIFVIHVWLLYIKGTNIQYTSIYVGKLKHQFTHYSTSFATEATHGFII